jgi:hypothetical protein
MIAVRLVQQEAWIMTTESAAFRCLELGLAGFIFLGGHFALAPVALAEDGAVAIVEDTSGKVAGIEALDLLPAGRRIVLGPDSGLIISYLDSCQRENIRGGKVVVGRTQSTVEGGEISRRRVACDAAALDLTPEQANQAATLVFREPPLEDGVKFRMETRQPLVIAPSLHEVTLEQIEPMPSHRVVKVVKGVADLTAGRNLLDKGALYRLSGGGKIVVFRIGKEATDAPVPVLQRAIRL